MSDMVFQRNYHPSDGPRRTILLVEDEPFVREATCSILEHAGFEVLLAENAPQAIQIYEERSNTNSKQKQKQKIKKIDLVMTDMILPGETGEQLGQNLRQHSPEVVVLITSGYCDAEFDAEVPNSRTYFLAKPYSRRSLLDKIEKILASVKPAWPASQAG